MHDKSKMYELEYPAPSVTSDDAAGPTLIVALQGFADAGAAIESLSSHLKAALEAHPIASFNGDELIDYRSRRPAVTLEGSRIVNAENLNLSIDAMKDSQGRPFMLLSGPEPDMRWEAFTEAVADIATKHNVQSAICLYSAPMTVPHTRPMVVSAHGDDSELTHDMFRIDSRITVPGSAALMLERVLHERQLTVAGFTAHVPHYISAGSYPNAALNLLKSIQDATGLLFPLQTLEADVERSDQQLEDYLNENAEVMQVVRTLEEQYDEEMERYRKDHPELSFPGEKPIPSGEEIGAEFERFLARVDDDDRRALGQGKSWEPDADETDEDPDQKD